MSHQSPAANNGVDPWIGRHVGEFRIVALLGKGGMGMVYKAVNRLLDTQVVAIKLLLDEGRERDDIQRRFVTEARVISSLNCEHVVRMIGFGTVAGPDGPATYLTMEYLDGESLESFLARTPRPPLSEIFRIIGPVFKGMVAAHRQTIIHRDLKPDNIFLAESDEGIKIKVLDFGLASRLDRKTANKTQDGALLGTVYYMAPEQAAGEKAGLESDVYAMGVLLYEMCTGCMPFDGQSPVIILGMIANSKIRATAPRSIDSSILPGLEWIMAKAMSKDRRHRYASMADMASDFDRVASGEHPVKATEEDAKRTFSDVPPVSRPGKEPSMSGADVKSRRTADTVDLPGKGGSVRLKSRLSFAATLVVLVIAGCAVWFFRRGEPARAVQPRTPRVTRSIDSPPTTPPVPPPSPPPAPRPAPLAVDIPAVPPPPVPSPPPPTATPDTPRPHARTGRRPPRRRPCGRDVRNAQGNLVPCL